MIFFSILRLLRVGGVQFPWLHVHSRLAADVDSSRQNERSSEAILWLRSLMDIEALASKLIQI